LKLDYKRHKFIKNKNTMIKLIVLLCISTIIFTQTVPSFNFSTIPSNTTATRTYCGQGTPTKKEDCTKYSDTFNYCCYMTPANGTANFCYNVAPTKFQTSMKTWNINGTNYGVDCGIQDGAMGTPCGVVNPTIYTDCTRYSTTNNSCCYYTNATIGVNYCFWIGMYMPYSPISAVQCTPPPVNVTSGTTTSSNYIQVYFVTFMLILVNLL
jgi:hypothetical protein